MIYIKTIPAIISSLLLGAHFLRFGEMGLLLVSLLFPFLLFIKKRWIISSMSIALAAGSAVWPATALRMIHIRFVLGEPWVRLAIILGGVFLFSLFAVFMLFSLRNHEPYNREESNSAASTAAFIATALLLGFARYKASFTILIFDRVIPGSGALEILLLAFYSAWVTEKMLVPGLTSKIRVRIWTIFSVVFFSQFILGVTGLDIFLMTGTLHIPVPALIIGGPLYRGSGLFMPVLFGSTILLVGPAWCSHLCYIGSWDNLAASGQKRPGSTPSRLPFFRAAILVLVIAIALLFNYFGVGPFTASIAALSFGSVGIAIMVFISRRKGLMIHCISYCPIGLLANLFGRISPFRVKIKDSCSECGACSRVCRYNALKPGDIQKRRAGFSCTLCGDCVAPCKDGSIGYRFFKLSPESARTLFIVIIVSMHAAFLGIAMI